MEKNTQLGLADLLPKEAQDEYNYYVNKLAEENGITPNHPKFKPAVADFLAEHNLGGFDLAAELGNAARVGIKGADYPSGILRLGESLGADVLAKATGAKNYTPTTYEEIKGALAGPMVPESAPGGFDVAERWMRAAGSDPSQHPIITAGIGVASDMTSPGMLVSMGKESAKKLSTKIAEITNKPTKAISEYVDPNNTKGITAAEMRQREKDILSSEKGRVLRTYGAGGESKLSPGAKAGIAAARAFLDAPGVVAKKISSLSRGMLYEDMNKLAERQPYVSVGTRYAQTRPEASKISNFVEDISNSPRSSGIGAFTQKGRADKIDSEIELAVQKMDSIVEKASEGEKAIKLDPRTWVEASKGVSEKNATSIIASKRAGAAAAESTEQLRFDLKTRGDIKKIPQAEAEIAQLEEFLNSGGVHPSDPAYKSFTRLIKKIKSDLAAPSEFTLKDALDRKREMQHILNELNAYDPASSAAVAPLTEALTKRSAKLTEVIEDALDSHTKGLGGEFREANKSIQKLINISQGDKGYAGVALTKEGRPVTASSNALIPIAYAGGGVRAGGQQILNPMAGAYMLTNLINLTRSKGALSQIADSDVLARLAPEAARSVLMEFSNKLYSNKDEQGLAKARARWIYGGKKTKDYIPLFTSPEVLSAWEETDKKGKK